MGFFDDVWNFVSNPVGQITGAIGSTVNDWSKGKFFQNQVFGGPQGGNGGVVKTLADNALSLSGGAIDYLNSERYRNDQIYNRDMTWNREDNAIQRRVADAERAGLSPLAVLGNGASSAPVSMSQPRNSVMENMVQALMLGKTQAEISEINARANASQALADKTRAEIPNVNLTGQEILAKIENLKQTTVTSKAQAEEIIAKANDILYEYNQKIKIGGTSNDGYITKEFISFRKVVVALARKWGINIDTLDIRPESNKSF